ncbi:MAG: SLBB domain-containing protein, partial [Pseudomonadota bacterium]
MSPIKPFVSIAAVQGVLKGLLLLACLTVSSFGASAQETSASRDLLSTLTGWTTTVTTDANAVVGIGDKVRIVLPGEKELDGTFQVGRSGRITLPEVGDVVAAGRSITQLQADVMAALERVYRAANTVQVTLAERRLLIEVGGSVRKPGTYDLPADVTIQAAIAEAGGLREGAQLNDVRVQRNGRNIVVDYALYLRTGQASLLPSLQSLDTIFVPTSPVLGDVYRGIDPTLFAKTGDAANPEQSITVIGEVHNPASYTYRDGNTVVDVLVRAGGVTRYAAVNQIRVLKGATPVLFDMQKYLDSGDQALLPKLSPGTTIFVPIQVEEVRAGKNTAFVMGQVDRPGAFAVA